MKGICPNTGLPTGDCECWYYDPDNKNAKWPSRKEFEIYVTEARQGLRSR